MKRFAAMAMVGMLFLSTAALAGKVVPDTGPPKFEPTKYTVDAIAYQVTDATLEKVKLQYDVCVNALPEIFAAPIEAVTFRLPDTKVTSRYVWRTRFDRQDDKLSITRFTPNVKYNSLKFSDLHRRMR